MVGFQKKKEINKLYKAAHVDQYKFTSDQQQDFESINPMFKNLQEMDENGELRDVKKEGQPE